MWLTRNSKVFNACYSSNFHISDKIGNNVLNFKYLNLKIKQIYTRQWDLNRDCHFVILFPLNIKIIFFHVWSIKNIQILSPGILPFCSQCTTNVFRSHRKSYHGDYTWTAIFEGTIPGSISGALFKVSASSKYNGYKKGFCLHNSSKYLQICFSITQQYVQLPTCCLSTVNAKQENFLETKNHYLLSKHVFHSVSKEDFFQLHCICYFDLQQRT